MPLGNKHKFFEPMMSQKPLPGEKERGFQGTDCLMRQRAGEAIIWGSGESLKEVIERPHILEKTLFGEITSDLYSLAFLSLGFLHKRMGVRITFLQGPSGFKS